ncbi:MAG: hypothetical protein GY760_27855 [Deltaproteobacteria bacterium]|nr:hypothetical protein [Deltaproteobacteria bacterium]
MKKVLLLLIIIATFFSCDININGYITNWFYNENHWKVDENKITYIGDETDSVAWINKEIPKNVEITFKWKAEQNDTDRNELIVILKGNKGLIGDFWTDGVNINYISSPEGNISEIRINGVYEGCEWPNYEDNLPLFDNKIEHECKIIYDNNILTFSIDNYIIHKGVIVKLDNENNFFGVANCWESSYKNEFYDVVINEL